MTNRKSSYFFFFFLRIKKSLLQIKTYVILKSDTFYYFPALTPFGTVYVYILKKKTLKVKGKKQKGWQLKKPSDVEKG